MTLGAMKRLLVAGLACLTASALAADAFPYDKDLAIDLSKAYLQAYGRKNSEVALMPSLGKPHIVSAVAAGNRRLVFVSYAIAGKKNGAYVELELCGENGLLTVVDVGEVEPISAYREDAKHISYKTHVASPVVCPAEVP